MYVMIQCYHKYQREGLVHHCLTFPYAGDRLCRVGALNCIVSKYIAIIQVTVETVFMFAEVDCGLPNNLTHATVGVSGTVYKFTANYTCDVGFMFPSGDKLSVVSCDDNGNWSTTNGTCEG